MDDNYNSLHKVPPYLPVPNSDIKLFDGNVVMFGTRPGISWVVHYGYYEYEDTCYNGWHFVSIPDHTIIPVFMSDLETVIVIAEDRNKKYPKPCPCPPKPFPPGPEIAIFTVKDEKQLRGAFITVDTIADRDELEDKDLPNGKIVKVNDVDGEVHFYTWSAADKSWNEFNIATKEDIEDMRPIWEII